MRDEGTNEARRRGGRAEWRKGAGNACWGKCQGLRGTDEVIYVGHSAGGWLARAALGDGTPESSLARLNAAEDVCGLVTLGTPHLPPPEGAEIDS